MYRIGQHVTTRPIRHQAFRNGRTQASFFKKTLIIFSYVIAYVIVAMAYWPASAGNVLTKINLFPAHLSSASGLSNRVHKADRPSGLSFDERWSAVPAPPTLVGGDKNRREAPRAESREKIPFSCELAFSRLVTRGNFSTRCMAGLETSTADT